MSNRIRPVDGWLNRLMRLGGMIKMCRIENWLLRPALEMDVPALAPWEPVLLDIGRTYRPDYAEAVAPQAKPQSLLRSRQI